MTASITHYRTETQCAALVVEELALPGEFWCYFGLHRSEPYAFLLDSARTLPGLGRYSFLGGAPWLVYTARRGPMGATLATAELELQYREPRDPRAAARRVERRSADVFETLEQLLREVRMPAAVRGGLPLPFLGGAVGYVGYEAAHFIERLPEHAQRDLDVPEVCLLFVDQLLAHDHATGLTRLVTTARAATPEAALAEAESRSADYRERLAAFTLEPPTVTKPARDATPVAVHAHATQADYVQTVERAQQHIQAGDAFEICTTHRLDAAYSGDSWALYQALREINPAPFACYLQLPQLQVVSSSPERFLKLTADRHAESRPIKGTRPRGATPEQDALLRAELLGSEKDRAENIMIVDLVRNDFGRVCEVDSIHVPELMIVEEHPSVFQMVSTVRGRLSQEYTALALLRACFPPGSMTGAPKVEAMKIIDALETYQRGVYSGCMGYFDGAGGMDFSVVIRSFVLSSARAYISVGGAVVADSDPSAEYVESLVKAQALLAALARVAAGGSP